MSGPDTPTGGLRAAVPYGLLFVIALTAPGTGGRYYLQRQAYLRDAGAVGRMNQKLAVNNVALSDAGCDSADGEVRLMALTLTAPAAKGWGGHPPRPELAARVLPAAVRLLSDPDARVRTKAIRALHGLNAADHVEAIRPRTHSADPREREAAAEAVQALTTTRRPE